VPTTETVCSPLPPLPVATFSDESRRLCALGIIGPLKTRQATNPAALAHLAQSGGSQQGDLPLRLRVAYGGMVTLWRIVKMGKMDSRSIFEHDIAQSILD
jgi:hypothetical protein